MKPNVLFASVSLLAISALTSLAALDAFTPTPTLEAKAGYFMFQSSKMRKIYKDGGIDAQVSCSYPIYTWSGSCFLDFYGSVEYLYRSGHSLGDHNQTSLWQLPINAGIKPIIAISEIVQYYIALGPRYVYLRQHNSSPYVPGHQSKSTVGFFANTGFNFVFPNHLLFDLFAEYSYARLHFNNSSHHVYGSTQQVGGWTFGAGLGYAF